MSKSLRVLLIADSDSQLHYCQVLSQSQPGQAVTITVNVVPRTGTPETVTERARGIGTVLQLSLRQLMRHPIITKVDAIGVFLTGSQIAGFRHAYLDECHRRSKTPALLFCGFNGVVLEKFEEGISWRLGYDLIALNGPRDQARLKRLLRHTPLQHQQTFLTGLRRCVDQTIRTERDHTQRARRLVFAEQVIMPSNAADRSRMVRIVADLASRSPNWDVVIKPRIRPQERTFHTSGEHIEMTVEKSLAMRPDNLHISYDPISELLSDSRLMATVSSTAVFDAMDLGCKPVVMQDFGWSAENGTSFFKDSGLMVELDKVACLDQLEADLEEPNPAWLQWVGYSHEHHPGAIYERLGALLSKREPQLDLNQAGYVIAHTKSDAPSLIGMSINQLRTDAEEAIRQRAWQEAAELLSDAVLQRPDHRNLRRRLKAVRTQNPILRQVRLFLSPRFKLNH